MKHNTKIVITGGGGVLGSHLFKRLSREKNVEVLVLDKVIKNHYSRIKNVKFIKCDIAKADDLKFLENADCVFHLACIKPEGGNSDISVSEFLKNIEMTVKVAESNKGAKIIYASGSNVYDIPLRIPIKEESALKPTELYGLSKSCGEAILKTFSEKYGWPLIVLRIANIYGPEFQREEGILFKFFNQLSKNQILEIYDDGKQKRDRVWIDDVTDAFILAMNRQVTGVFNIGSGESYSTLEVARLIGKFLNKEPKLIFIKNTNVKKENNLLDIQKARKVLNYNPKMNFKDGLRVILDSWGQKHENHLY